jgi:hypothetical protein
VVVHTVLHGHHKPADGKGPGDPGGCRRLGADERDVVRLVDVIDDPDGTGPRAFWGSQGQRLAMLQGAQRLTTGEPGDIGAALRKPGQ